MTGTRILVDSNIILDIILEDKKWASWSSTKLEELSEQAVLVINQAIFAEISIGFQRIEEIEDALPETFFIRESIPWEAAFLAGKCFLKYRQAGGTKGSPLPDFFIGAHAAVKKYALITRDAARYRTYFPTVVLHCP